MKFLLVKLNHLGDTLLLTPTLRYLREKHPQARIDVIVRRGCEVMLENNPDLTHLIGIARPEKSRRSLTGSLREFFGALRQTTAQRYDYAFDLSDSDRAKFWITLSLARQRGINCAYGEPDWKKRWLFNRHSQFLWGSEHQVLKDFRTVTDILGDAGARPGPLVFRPKANWGSVRPKLPGFDSEKPFAVVHATSRWPFKEWLPDRWAKLAGSLSQNHGLQVVLSSGPDQREAEYITAIRAAATTPLLATEGRLSLHELAFLLGQARLFAGVDTVAMHLAAAMQTPIVALFGPSSEWSWRPWQCPQELVFGPCECKQTRKFVCDKSQPYPCMQAISLEQVMTATGTLLAGLPAK